MTALTSEQITQIRRVAASGDPFMQGAVWMLDQITTQPAREETWDDE